MLRTATPNGLDPAMQRYAAGPDAFAPATADCVLWPAAAVRQVLLALHQRLPSAWHRPLGRDRAESPEALADVGWEKCLWTPQFQAQFVKNHLGPVLRAEQPGVKIIGFDHNKDHVVEWATGSYADLEAAAFFDGIGVHWYGGLNIHNLNNAHQVRPDKFLLATEACNCPGDEAEERGHGDGRA